MLIVGAGGHALEVLDELNRQNVLDNLCFYDDKNLVNIFQKNFKILNSEKAVISQYQKCFTFILGIGNPILRKSLTSRFEKLGGKLKGVISISSIIGKFNVNIDQGVDIMSNANISSNVCIGKGTLINRSVIIHHDCSIGEYCEIAPGAILLGNVQVGEMSFIGAGAIILPNIKIGSNCIIAAGAVLTKDICDNIVVKGLPAKEC